MNTTTAYIEETFSKIRLLKTGEKGEVWLAADKSGKLVVVKEIYFTGLRCWAKNIAAI